MLEVWSTSLICMLDHCDLLVWTSNLTRPIVMPGWHTDGGKHSSSRYLHTPAVDRFTFDINRFTTPSNPGCTQAKHHIPSVRGFAARRAEDHAPLALGTTTPTTNAVHPRARRLSAAALMGSPPRGAYSAKSASPGSLPEPLPDESPLLGASASAIGRSHTRTCIEGRGVGRRLVCGCRHHAGFCRKPRCTTAIRYMSHMHTAKISHAT